LTGWAFFSFLFFSFLAAFRYIDRIDELNMELTKAWESDQRVKALKIAIQCAKLLADTRVIQFYPYKDFHIIWTPAPLSLPHPPPHAASKTRRSRMHSPQPPRGPIC